MSDDGGFLSRWSKRKVALREGRERVPEPPAEVPPPVAAEPAPAVIEPPAAVAPPVPEVEPPPPPPPTLDDVALLTRQSDFRRFVAPDVDAGVKNAALKKLFTDPQFNVMDGLDTYIDDYGKPDPLPASMLRKMVQSVALGLFKDEEEAQTQAPPQPLAAASLPEPPSEVPETPKANDQDPAVRLQPDDAAGSPGPAGGAGEDAGRER